MKTKSIALTGVLLALGYVLHTVVPPLFLGMKPDMLLTMMFLAILIYPQKTNVLLASLGAGVISALTTGFPGSQLANLIEKPITGFLFFGLLLAVSKYRNNAVTATALAAVGTIISGFIFLSAALLISGLPGSFIGLILTVVLPTAVINAAVMLLAYPVARRFIRMNQPVKTLQKKSA